MRITQGTFSFLPDLTDDEIRAQVEYALRNGWACSIEYTDDAHPRNTYWDMWGQPMFDLKDAAGVMTELQACREAVPGQYIKINAFDATRGVESLALSFIVQRPVDEPGFRLTRQEGTDRVVRYTLEPYATTRPAGERYRQAPAGAAPVEAPSVGAPSVGAAHGRDHRSSKPPLRPRGAPTNT